MGRAVGNRAVIKECLTSCEELAQLDRVPLLDSMDRIPTDLADAQYVLMHLVLRDGVKSVGQ